MNISTALGSAPLERLDAEVLLAAALRRDRSWLLAHPDASLTPYQQDQFAEWTERRLAKQPVAYILGEKEFFGRTFTVDISVLIPRPATEGLVEQAMTFLGRGEESLEETDTEIVAWTQRLRPGTPEMIVDIGTGSGCIGITLAAETGMPALCTDISEQALHVAEYNITRHAVETNVSLAQGSLLEPVQHLTTPFLLTSNPPYVPEGEPLMPDVGLYEPQAALFGGPDGMRVLLPLLREAQRHPACIGCTIECRRSQAKALAER